jgi:putative tryptophan/tyrosine transport system substrate-binding protein
MKRRTFIAGLGSAAAWPVVARAQPGGRMRRIGILLHLAADDPETVRRMAAFKQALQELGWTEGRTVQFDFRSGQANGDLYRRYAAELVALAPDVLLANGGVTLGHLQQATRTVPIVFVQTTDPVGGGYVESLARPGGNATGFMSIEYSMSGKWLELLKQIAPNVQRVAVLRDPAVGSGNAQFAVIQTVAQLLRMEVTPGDARDVGQIERAIAAFARGSNGGLIVTSNTFMQIHRDLIITLAARHHLPAVYPYRFFITGGGLISYGPDTIDPLRRAAGYVDRILKGEKPADLPVQQATRAELTINLKTAKALGLTIPETLLATADEVIQ